jgi:single-strand DNA-binding protein
MSEIKISGQLFRVFPEKTVGNKGFKVREFVLQTTEKYPQFIQMKLTQEKCGLLDRFKDGEYLTAVVNIRGNKYEKDGKESFFNSIEAWQLHLDATVNPQAVQESAPVEASDDDLAF